MEKVDIGKECPLFKQKCMKGSCVWWIKDAENCTLVVLTDEIYDLDRKMNEFVNYYYSANLDKSHRS